MSQTSEIVAAAERHLYPNYKQPPVVLDHGEGSILWDTDGRRYVDFYAGIAVSALGHAHPALVAAVTAQAKKLLHQSNYYLSEPNVRLAEKLCQLTGLDRAFFCNSGTEANEAALKLARRHFFDQGQKDRFRVISFDRSFHGRTLGSLTVTGQSKYSEGFGPTSGATHVPYGDLEAVKAAFGPDVAAVIVEPVQGEGGVHPAPKGFLTGLRALCDEHGALLILDEIQTGAGRTGTFIAAQHEGVRPDLLTLAKGIGGGAAIGTLMTTEALKDALPPGSHGTTFGGNPLASAAALATVETIESDNLLANVQLQGKKLEERLEALCVKLPCLSHRRGIGLLQAIVLNDGVDGPGLIATLRNAGVLLTLAGGNALRFTPPLNISDSELQEGLDIVEQVLAEL